MSVERSKVTVACLHSDINPLCPVGAVGGFLMFWCRADLHSPWLPVFLNSVSTDSLKPSEGLPPVLYSAGYPASRESTVYGSISMGFAYGLE